MLQTTTVERRTLEPQRIKQEEGDHPPLADATSPANRIGV